MMKRRNLWLCILLVTLLLPTITSCPAPPKTSDGTTNESNTDATALPNIEENPSDTTAVDHLNAPLAYFYSAKYYSFSTREFDLTAEDSEALISIINKNEWSKEPPVGDYSMNRYELKVDGRTMQYYHLDGILSDTGKKCYIKFSKEDNHAFWEILYNRGFPPVNYDYELITENGSRYMVFDPLLKPFSDDCFPSLNLRSFADLKERVQQVEDKTLSRFHLTYIMNFFNSKNNKILILSPDDLRYPVYPKQVYHAYGEVFWHSEGYFYDFKSADIYGNFEYYGHSENAQNQLLEDAYSFSENARITSSEITEDGKEIYQITETTTNKTINYKLIRYELQSDDTTYYVHERYAEDNTSDIPSILNIYGMQGAHCFHFNISRLSAPITKEYVFSFGITDEYYEELDAEAPNQISA